MNQYTAIGTATPSYDLDGNATSYPIPAIAGGSSTLIWDAENRLIEVKNNSAVTIATYAYDYLGRSISKTAGTPTTRFIYDGWNPVANYTATIPNSTFLIQNSYTWAMDLSGSMQGAGGVGGLLAVNELSIINSQLSTISYYPTNDGNGNVSEYLDSAGAVQAHYDYDAFGNTIVSSGAKVNDFAHRFSTKPLDAETGLYYYGYRYYDPVTGRWPSRDPIEERGGLNVYGFVYNKALGWIDILGLKERGCNATVTAGHYTKKDGEFNLEGGGIDDEFAKDLVNGNTNCFYIGCGANDLNQFAWDVGFGFVPDLPNNYLPENVHPDWENEGFPEPGGGYGPNESPGDYGIGDDNLWPDNDGDGDPDLNDMDEQFDSAPGVIKQELCGCCEEIQITYKCLEGYENPKCGTTVTYSCK